LSKYENGIIDPETKINTENLYFPKLDSRFSLLPGRLARLKETTGFDRGKSLSGLSENKTLCLSNPNG